MPNMLSFQTLESLNGLIYDLYCFNGLIPHLHLSNSSTTLCIEPRVDYSSPQLHICPACIAVYPRGIGHDSSEHVSKGRQVAGQRRDVSWGTFQGGQLEAIYRERVN